MAVVFTKGRGSTIAPEVKVEINADKTRAILFLLKDGDFPPNMKAVSHALKESEIHSYNADELKAALQMFMDGEETEFSYVFAEGKPAVRGGDRAIKLEVRRLPPEKEKPVIERLKAWHSKDISRDTLFDPQRKLALAFVEKDALIARVSESSKGEDGKDIYGNVIPGLPGNDPKIKLVNGLSFRDPEIRAVQEGLLIFEASGKSFAGEVLDCQDAKIGIHISEDAMEARGDFFREVGAGIPLTLENVEKVLAALQIKKGIDWEGLENACVQTRTTGSALGCLVAKGETPIARGGLAVKWLTSLSPSENGTGGEDAVQVKAGEPIAEIYGPFADGRQGFDVKGKVLPIEGGVTQTVDHDGAIREQPFEKGLRLLAARSGELSFDGKKLNISSIKAISADAEGNINFSGEIQIRGNVLSGAVITGGSHVKVEGYAGASSISAEGRIIVKNGFKGGGKGMLKARAGIEAAFVERAAVLAIGDVHLNMGSILSSIKTGGKILVSAEDGKLEGGVYRARYGIEAADIGSGTEGVRTAISFGQDYFLKDEIDAAEEEINDINNELVKTEEKLNESRKNGLSLSKEQIGEKVNLVKQLEELKRKQLMLKDKFEEHFESEVRASGTIFPGVVIESHNRYYEVNQKRNRVIFFFDRESGTIKERPFDDPF